MTFESYGALAGTNLSETVQAGRYSDQAAAERRIAPDVARKLKLGKTDILLDIGCGPGVVTRALAKKAARVTAVDHPATIAHLNHKVRGQNIELLAGNFLDLKINRAFDKIVAYGVLRTLGSPAEGRRFVEKAVKLLKPGGLALIGDLPNVDLKARFLSTPAGKRFDANWKKKHREVAPIKYDYDWGHKLNDVFVLGQMARLRARGFHAWLLPQDPRLPFGNSREDLLIARPA